MNSGTRSKDTAGGRVINLKFTPEELVEHEAWLDANPHLRRSSDIAAKLIAGTATPEELAELDELTKDVGKDFVLGHIDDRTPEERERDQEREKVSNS